MLPTETYDLFAWICLRKSHMELTQNLLYYNAITNKIHTNMLKRKAKTKLRYLIIFIFLLFYFIVNNLYVM